MSADQEAAPNQGADAAHHDAELVDAETGCRRRIRHPAILLPLTSPHSASHSLSRSHISYYGNGLGLTNADRSTMKWGALPPARIGAKDIRDLWRSSQTYQAKSERRHPRLKSSSIPPTPQSTGGLEGLCADPLPRA